MKCRIRQMVPLAALGLMVFVAAGCGGSPAEMSDGNGQMKSPMQPMSGSGMADAPAVQGDPMVDAPAMDGNHMAGAAKMAKAETTATMASNQIVIDNFTFNPSTLTVPSGTEVTWVNHDDVPHTVTHSVKPRLFDSGTMDSDARFSHKFTTPGTYDYFCALHPRMTAKIIVK